MLRLGRPALCHAGLGVGGAPLQSILQWQANISSGGPLLFTTLLHVTNKPDSSAKRADDHNGNSAPMQRVTGRSRDLLDLIAQQPIPTPPTPPALLHVRTYFITRDFCQDHRYCCH